MEESVSGKAFPASFGIDPLSLRQNGSLVNLVLRSGTGGRTTINSEDAVTPGPCGCSDSHEKAAVTIKRAPAL
ncbi:MAG: hypothetical protein ACLPX5_03175 [Dissulfurispiraceae bacterium]